MPPAGFEPAISASEQPQIHAIDSVATGIRLSGIYETKNIVWDSVLEHHCVIALNVCLSAVYKSPNAVYKRQIRDENL